VKQNHKRKSLKTLIGIRKKHEDGFVHLAIAFSFNQARPVRYLPVIGEAASPFLVDTMVGFT